ncbi:MAG TPA: class I SAM-dependent methyltransferase [Ilumatobacter sp.]|nr:class I SAM-dependent methyltransferase [Ilumatobacter sp.]
MPATPAPVTPDAAWAAVADVAGWMSRGQSDALFAAAAAAPDDAQIVEIGSFQGRSTVVLALAAPAHARIVAIDPHAGNDRGPQEIEGYITEAEGDHQRFLANLDRAGVADRVTHIRKFSDAALGDVAGAIDVLYIDGAHRYAPARADIVAWGNRVNVSGRLLIHDSFSSIGVTLAILRELAFGRRFRYVGRARSLASYEAVPGGLAGRERVGNAVRQLAQLGWFARNVALKVLLSAGLGRVLARLGKEPPEWPY